MSFILILRKPREGQAAVQARQGLLSPKVIYMCSRPGNNTRAV
jgi:hypothetical protein